MALDFPMFELFNSCGFALVALTFIIGNPIIRASAYGPIGDFRAEKFDTRSCYTGVSLIYQIRSVLGGHCPADGYTAGRPG